MTFADPDSRSRPAGRAVVVGRTEVVAHTIGQTPRPDLTCELTDALGGIPVEIRGALDELRSERIPDFRPGGYPLETRLRDGQRVVVDAAFLEPRLQRCISAEDEADAIQIILCAGSFPGLRSRGTLIQPFEAATAELAERGFRTLEVIVPFEAQAGPARDKWKVAGFSCRTYIPPRDLQTSFPALESSTDPQRRSPLASWVRDRLAGSDSDAVVFDYVGFPGALLDGVAAAIDLPVLDVGRLGLAALERAVQDRTSPER